MSSPTKRRLLESHWFTTQALGDLARAIADEDAERAYHAAQSLVRAIADMALVLPHGAARGRIEQLLSHLADAIVETPAGQIIKGKTELPSRRLPEKGSPDEGSSG